MRFCFTVIATVFAAFAAIAPAQAQVQIYCDGQTENLNTYLKIHKVLFMDRDTSRVSEFYADQIISHNNDAGGPGSLVPSSSMAKMWEASKKNNPERVLEDELILCSGDFVTLRTVVKSSFTTPIEGIEPTGQPYEITAIDIYRFENGKVVERWGNADVAFIYKQLGFELVAGDK